MKKVIEILKSKGYSMNNEWVYKTKNHTLENQRIINGNGECVMLIDGCFGYNEVTANAILKEMI